MNANLTLKARLVRYLRANPTWISSGDLQRLVADKTTYTPRTTCRRLEELAQEGAIEVSYRKGHAWYKHRSQSLPEANKEVLDFDLQATLKAMDLYAKEIGL